jgi:hypothetical protein
MEQFSDITFEYDRLEEWSGPATWGQRAIWIPIEWYAPDDHYFNLGRVLPLGSGLAPADLAVVLRDAVTRHPALRTSFTVWPDGSLRQILHGSGRLRVRHFAAERDRAQEVARSLLADELRERFDLSAGPPLRVTAVGSADLVYAVGLVLSHITSDGAGMEVLVDDLRQLAAHRRRDPSRLPPRPEGRTPREQAQYEAGPIAQRRSDAALDRWRRLLDDAPARLLPPALPAPARTLDRWRAAWLEGPAADLASRWLAHCWHRTPGAVMLAAFASCLTALTGHDPVALKVIVGNRVSAAQRTAVGNFAQDGLVCLRSGGLPLAELAAKAEAALLTAARHGQYDPDAMRHLVAKAGRERGGVFELDSYFNDFRPSAAAPDEQHVRALEPGRVHWAGTWAKQDSSMFFALWQEDGAPRIRLLTDTLRLPPEQAEALLSGVQDVLLREARRTSLPKPV